MAGDIGTVSGADATARKRAQRAVREDRVAGERLARRFQRERIADEAAAQRARDGSVDPTPERREHGAVRRSDRQEVDANGAIGDPWRTVDLLARLAANGKITGAMREAGERFAGLFHRAAFPDVRAGAFIRIGGGGGAAYETNGNEGARRAVAEGIRVLGGFASPAASCIWHVVGLEWSLRKWGETHWDCRHDVSSGVLIAGLGVLVEHFGLDRVAAKKRSN